MKPPHLYKPRLERLEDRNAPAVSFAEPIPLPAGFPVWNLQAADFNEDGRLDLLGSDGDPWTGISQAWVVFGNGDGTFQPKRLVGDTAYSRIGYEGVYALYRENDGTLPRINYKEIVTYMGFYLSSHAIARDFDGDGHMDVFGVESYSDGKPISFRRFVVFRGLGDGTFEDAIYDRMFLSVSDARTPMGQEGDLDGDSIEDRIERPKIENPPIILGYEINFATDQAIFSRPYTAEELRISQEEVDIYLSSDPVPQRFNFRSNGSLQLFDLNKDGFDDVISRGKVFMNTTGQALRPEDNPEPANQHLTPDSLDAKPTVLLPVVEFDASESTAPEPVPSPPLAPGVSQVPEPPASTDSRIELERSEIKTPRAIEGAPVVAFDRNHTDFIAALFALAADRRARQAFTFVLLLEAPGEPSEPASVRSSV